MSYNKLGFTSGQTLKAEHLNHMEDGIESISNNVQIKKIVFTDRPSIYQWLLENYSKVIYINVKSLEYPWFVKYMVHAHYFNGIVGFGLVQISTNFAATLVPSTIILRDNETEMSIDERINVDSDNTISGIYVEPVVIPDEYWSVMGIEGTAYYFDE